MKISRTNRSPRQASGFTLLEVILAMAVGAIVVLAVQGAFFGALRLRNTAQRRSDQELSLYRALDRIKKDFLGLMLPGGTIATSFQTAVDYNLDSSIQGERISAEFFTNSGEISPLTPFADAQRVAYYLQPGPDPDRYDLVRTFSRNLLTATADQPEVQWLLGNVASAFFEYFDGSTWVDTWDSEATASLPKAVRLTLQLAEDSNDGVMRTAPVEMVIPVFVSLAATDSPEPEAVP